MQQQHIDADGAESRASVANFTFLYSSNNLLLPFSVSGLHTKMSFNISVTGITEQCALLFLIFMSFCVCVCVCVTYADEARLHSQRRHHEGAGNDSIQQSAVPT